MDNFYYILIKNNGDIIHNIFATSHRDLIGKYTTPEDARDKTYIKAMFSPKDGYRLDDVNNYQLIHAGSHIWLNPCTKPFYMYLRIRNTIFLN